MIHLGCISGRGGPQGKRMKLRARVVVLAVGLALAGTGVVTVWAQDANPTLTQRQDRMKAISRAFGTVKAYTEDKADLAAARAAGTALVRLTGDIPTRFPE